MWRSLWYVLLVGHIFAPTASPASDPMPLQESKHLFRNVPSIYQHDGRHMVIALQNFGFANRMRTLASFLQLSSRLGRRLHVAWIKTKDCGSAWDDLFARPTLPSGRAYHNGMYFDIFEGDEERLITNINNRSLTTELKGMSLNLGSPYYTDAAELHTIVLHHQGWFKILGEPCMSYLVKKSHFYQTLRPVPAVQNVVDHVWDSSLVGNVVVGVHVRATKQENDWPSVAYDGTFLSFDEVAPLEQIYARMKEVWEFRPNVKFYVASNDGSVKSALMDSFPRGVCFGIRLQEGSLVRDTTEGIQMAVAEFILLSRTELVVHTFGSSFAQEASFLGRVPELLIRKGGDVFHSNDYATPACHHSSMKYIDGSVERSQTTGLPRNKPFPFDLTAPGEVSVSLCKFLKARWGIAFAYCLATDE